MPRFEHIRRAIPASTRRNPFTGDMQVVPEVPAKKTIFEIEQRGSIVETCTLKPGKRPRYASMRYQTSAQAERSVREEIARKLVAKYVEVGPARMLAPAPANGTSTGSTLLLDEFFLAGDHRFLDEVLACTSDRKLTSLAEPWLADTRPEMRRALLDYVDDGCDRWFHKGLVKHLFKAAERHGDDELMAHFMVAFDRLSRRYPVERSRWDFNTRSSTTETVLYSNPLVPERHAGNEARATHTVARFSRATRRYLARRAFRYFRAIGRTDKARYGRAMRTALALYKDEHLDSPVSILDSWSLLHVLYAWSPVLDRSPRGIRVVRGRSLGEVKPAPYFPDAYKGEFHALIDLLVRARSRPVRVWTIGWLESTYAVELESIDIATLRPLLVSFDEDVARFGSSLLAKARGLDTFSIEEWLALLRSDNLDVAPVVAAAFEKHVSPRRLSFAQSVELTSARLAVIAELGLRWAIERKPTSSADLTAFARVANASVEYVRRDGTRYLLTLLDSHADRRAEILRDLFDARFADVRAIAKEYLEAKGDGVAADIPLWFALLESPFDDVRALVVKHAERWQAHAGVGEIEHLAASVLLAVHRGATTKQSMLRRIADRAAEHPTEAERLLPVLSIALRSVRLPERVGALTALTRAAIAHESLR
ncbi:MAG TPA: hypothetical protein VM925_24220, partial [Labilithrix sp.]|nr:hypothetical protein [Labilithrix sp.]